jgi:hypothetical protein
MYTMGLADLGFKNCTAIINQSYGSLTQVFKDVACDSSKLLVITETEA